MEKNPANIEKQEETLSPSYAGGSYWIYGEI